MQKTGKYFWTFIAILAVFTGCSQADISAETADCGMGSIDFLDVGQGLAVLFSAENENWNALYDTGNDSNGFGDTLKNRHIEHLNWVLVSHWHRDHAGGLLEWTADWKIDTLFYGSDTGGSWLRDSVFKLAKKFGTPVVPVIRGSKLPCAGWDCKILWPPDFLRLEGNNASVVLQMADGKRRALFTGDLESEFEQYLLDISRDLQADLLQVGHHGSKTSSSIAFLEQVSPAIAAISAGKQNPYGHPAASTLQKLSLFIPDSSHILRTDLLGSFSIKWKINKALWIEKY